MPADELTEWAAYEQVTGPLGPERDDVLASMVAFYVSSALGAKKLKMHQLLPRWDRKPTQDWRQMRMIAEALTRQYGGTVAERN